MAREIEGMTVKVGLDATEVTEGVKKTNASLKEEEANLKRVNQNMKFDTSKVDAWRNKSEALRRVITALNAKITEQKKKVEEAAKAAETGGTKAKAKYASELSQLDKLNKKLEDYNLQLTQSESNEKAASGQELAAGLAKVAVVAAAAIAAIKKVAEALMNMATSATEAIVSINESAVNAGLAVEEYQRLAYAAGQVFVQESTMESALTKVNGILGDLAKGDGLEAAQTLDKIGLSYQDIVNMDTEDAFYAIIDALGKMENQTEALGYANDLFGDKLGTKLLPVIEAGSDAMKEYASQAVVVTEAESQLANQSDSLMSNIENEMTKINAQILPLAVRVLEVVSDVLQNEVMPLVTELFDYFEEGADSGAFDGVLEACKSLGKLLKELIVDVGRIVADLMPALNSIFRLLSPILDLVTNLLDALMPIVDSILQPVNDLLVEIIDPITELCNTLLPAITASVKATSAQTSTLFKIIGPLVKMVGESLNFQLQMLNTFFQPLVKVIEWLSEALSGLMVYLQPVIDGVNWLFERVKEFFDWVLDKVNKFGSWILGLIGIDTSGIGDQIEEAASKISAGTDNSTANGEVNNNTTNNSYNVTINTTATEVSIEDIDRALAAA